MLGYLMAIRNTYITTTWYSLGHLAIIWLFVLFSPVLVNFIKKNLATLALEAENLRHEKHSLGCTLLMPFAVKRRIRGTE
jgi:hypothetical protein